MYVRRKVPALTSNSRKETCIILKRPRFFIGLTNISLIQETWTRGNKIHGFGQHNCLFYHRTGGRPRTAFYVSPNLNAIIPNQLSNEDLTVIMICRKRGGRWRLFSHIHDSPTIPPGQNFEKLINFSRDNHLQLITGCDSNAYHVIWGSKSINERGNAIIQYLATTDLIIINKGRKPTFVNKVRKERLDITLASYNISELL